MEAQPITLETILYVFRLLVAIVAGITAIIAIVKWITQIHDRNKKLDGYEKDIAEVKTAIADLQTDMEAKMQCMRTEQLIITDSILAILDGLGQLNCNGPVTEAKNHLLEYINERAHDGKQ